MVNNKPITCVVISRRGPPRSQQSDLSNKFSIASTTMPSLDTDSDFDLKFTDVHFTDRSVSGCTAAIIINFTAKCMCSKQPPCKIL